MTPDERPDWEPEPIRPRRPHEFDDMYTSTPPWDIGRPQRAFLELAETGMLSGRVLDVGCGTGEHALMAADLGLEAVGVDLSPRAVAIAQQKATERGSTARFSVHDALDLGSLGERFDVVIDCGLFHVFEDPDRSRLVESLGRVVPEGGRYFMLCFSDRQPGDWGPRRVTRDEISESFEAGWRVDRIDDATIELTLDPNGARAWRAALTRTG